MTLIESVAASPRARQAALDHDNRPAAAEVRDRIREAEHQRERLEWSLSTFLVRRFLAATVEEEAELTVEIEAEEAAIAACELEIARCRVIVERLAD